MFILCNQNNTSTTLETVSNCLETAVTLEYMDCNKNKIYFKRLATICIYIFMHYNLRDKCNWKKLLMKMCNNPFLPFSFIFLGLELQCFHIACIAIIDYLLI